MDVDWLWSENMACMWYATLPVGQTTLAQGAAICAVRFARVVEAVGGCGLAME